MTGRDRRRSARDEEAHLANLRRRQSRDRARVDRDDGLLPGSDDRDSWEIGDGAVRRRVPAPREIGDVLDGVIASLGWRDRLRTTDVVRRWPDIVGETIAEHTRPVRLAGGILVIAAPDTSWATQVRYLVDEIRQHVNSHLPEHQAVRQVDVVVDRGDGRA